MDSNPASPFAVGYGNGYGYPTEVSPSMQVTTTMPAIDTAALLASAPPAATIDTEGRRWAARSAVAALLIVAVIGGLVLVGAGRQRSLGLGVTSSHGATMARSDASDGARLGLGLGGSIPEQPGAPGTPIVLDDPTNGAAATTTTATPTTAPTTAPGPSTTTAPTVPPSTTPPSTTPPPTLGPPPSITTPPSIPPLVLMPSITSFTMPATGGCVGPFYVPQFLNVSWNTNHATKVTISIDGPGIYDTYFGSAGSDTVPFACPGSHTYLLTAYNSSGMSVSQSITIHG